MANGRNRDASSSRRQGNDPEHAAARRTSMSIEYAIEVGSRLFAERGYASTTTRQLAKAFGITNGTFYHYFSSKEELLRLCCERSLETLLQEVGDAIRNEPAGAKLSSLIRQHMNSVLTQQELHKTMLTEIDGLGDKSRDRIIALRDQYEALVASALRDADRAGVVRSDIDGRTMTLLLLNLMNWTIFWFRPDGRLTPRSLAHAAETLFLDGARPR